jgi:ABC-type Fe3+ transport system substrate-binding protein
MISRRAMGLGLLGLSVAGTAAYLALGDRPGVLGSLGKADKLFGFAGGEKQALVQDPAVMAALRSFALTLDARQAGSVEMVREKQLLDQAPQFLWPASSILVELAKQNGVKVRKDEAILSSPLVIYSWSSVAAGLEKNGFITRFEGDNLGLDLAKLLTAMLEQKSWSDEGVPDLFGRVRIVATDPQRSNSGFAFAGLVANLLNGDVLTAAKLPPIQPKVASIFEAMGFKTHSSGKLFDDYIAGGPGVLPMAVGYENQLVEWILADTARWQRVTSAKGDRPVVLYPRPSVFASHPLIAIDQRADRLIEALLSPAVQKIAWESHGFRGPLGAAIGDISAKLGTSLPARIGSVTPMPAADVMLNLIGMV